MSSSTELADLEVEVVRCRKCPRLVEYREDIAVRKVKRFADQAYWGKPVPSFGDPGAQLLIVGLAPGAHGSNRTGRMFTGDRSGDWLFEALHRYGFANQPGSEATDDGLELQKALISAVVRCAPPANKPTAQEKEACRNYLVRELGALGGLKVVVALGKIGYDGFLAAWAQSGREPPKPKPQFAHLALTQLEGGPVLLASYHPSQQNTFTGRLTRPMFHAVFATARRLVDA